MDRATIEANYCTPLMVEPTTQYAYRFFHEGILALADVEQNGIRIDVPKAKEAYKQAGKDIDRLMDKLGDHEAMKEWKKQYKNNVNFDSDTQLKKVLKKFVGEDVPKADAETLKKLDYDKKFILDFIQIRKKKKLRNTYLNSILRETVDGWLHPFFHLHIARSFRSSSSDPNFQNMPSRDYAMMQIVRSVILGWPGHHLVELDYSGVEVSTSCWYHQDPVMLEYQADPIANDMHGDMGVQLYKLDTLDKHDSLEKHIRKCAKNSFVFPQFYGDYYVKCAQNLWGDINKYDLHLRDNTPLKRHLSSKGIKNYKQFEKHVQEVEKDFWGRRFKVYQEWKDATWEKYLKNGYVQYLNGFVASGMLRYNQATNLPIQGLAFHALLWSLIRINNKLKAEGWESRIVGQIHDSIIATVAPHELQDFLGMANKVMTRDLPKEWSFINTPLEIEADCAEVDAPWSTKEEIALPSV